MIRFTMPALALSLSLAGCATQPPTYDADSSRALNIAHAAGLSKAKDYPSSKAPSGGVGAVMDVTTSAISFESDFGLGMTMGDAVGLSLLSFAFSPPSQMNRNSILAWVPQGQAADKEHAALALSEQVLEAAEKTLKAGGISYQVEKAHEQRLALFYPYLDTSVAFTVDGLKCGIRYHIYKTQITNPKPLPAFIGDGVPAYSFIPGDEVQYPSFDLGCLEGNPLVAIELARKISLALPETVFLYMAPKRLAQGGKTPPMVMDHGKALMFLEPKASR